MSTTSGWGRFTWGQANWNESQKFGAGWGAKTWNEQSWGDLNDVTVSVTGQEITSSMGIEGWVIILTVKVLGVSLQSQLV